MSPEEELRFLILGAQREGNRQFASMLAPLKLTPSQAEVLRCLAEWEPISLQELGRRLVCEQGSPSRLVSATVGRGWVVRRENAGDRRQVILTLSDEGRRLAQSVHAIEQRLHDWIGERLAHSEIERLNEALRNLLDGSTAGEAIALRKADAGT